MLPVTYDPAIMALSVVIAIQGGYVSLTLARRLAEVSASPRPQMLGNAGRRKALLAASALALGVGIWAMHFIGMLAVKLPIVVTYDLLWTLISALVCILVVGLGVFVASFGVLTTLRLGVAGLLMGAGTTIMHYIGMSALRANCVVSYSPPLVVASFVIAVAASSLALWLAFSPRHRPHVMAGAVTMGLAISGMHYTGMAAATFLPVEDLVAISAPVLSLHLLAIVVAVTAFVICGLFLLVMLPDRVGGEEPGVQQDLQAANLHAGDLQPGDLQAEDLARRSAAYVLAAAPAGTVASAERDDDPKRPAFDRIPVDRNGSTKLLAPEDIYAIQADSHYTQVFDGEQVHFCSLSISELEARLDPRMFLRVHRSHIVNVAYASEIRRVRDQGLIELSSSTAHSVPVSRSRLPKLREALGL